MRDTVVVAHGATVAWRRVALFYAIALGGAAAMAGLLVAFGSALPASAATLVFGGGTMLFPLVAGLVTERVAGRRTLASREWGALRARPWRFLGLAVGVGLAGFAVVTLGQALVFLLTTGLGLPGAGTLTTQAQFDETIRALSPAMPEGVSVPIAVVVASGLVGSVVAGLTINAVFGLGEEYGWRGVLAEELRPLGLVRANVAIGVVWGLWHAPLIRLGHNYGPDWAVGIPLFVAVCIPLSFILWWARERSGSVLAPAIVHGAFNGFAGTFVLLAHEGNRLLTVPVGVFGALAVALVAGVLWWTPGLRPPRVRTVGDAPA